ncbi:hypothetical protein MCEMSE15_00950 [Fimbriimonadaceae bacterium]
MNENAKKAGLVAIIVLAVGAAAFSAYNISQGDKMVIDNVTKMPEGHKSEKELALESQAQAGAAATAPAGEKDLGGDLTGAGGGKE